MLSIPSIAVSREEPNITAKANRSVSADAARLLCLILAEIPETSAPARIAPVIGNNGTDQIPRNAFK